MNKFILLQTNSLKKDRCKLQDDRSTVCHNICYLNEHLRQSVTAVNRFCWWWNVEERPQELSLVDSEEVEVIARLSVCDPGCGCQILRVTALMLSSGCGTVPGRRRGGGSLRQSGEPVSVRSPSRRDPSPHPEYAPLTTRIVCSLPSLPRP